MPIGRHPFWGVADDVESLLEKALGRLPISLLAQQLIHQMVIAINGSLQITPFPFDADRRFIHVSGARLFARDAWLVPDWLAMEQGELPTPSRSPEYIQCRAARTSRPDPAGSTCSAAARRQPEGRHRWDSRES